MLGGELALPVSGGSHQPLDRHFRYYSEAPRLASVLCGYLTPQSGEGNPRPTAKRKKRHPERSGVLLSCAGHWPPKYIVDGGCFRRTYCRLSPPVIPIIRAALYADALAGCLLFFGLAGLISSSRYITGTLGVAI